MALDLTALKSAVADIEVKAEAFARDIPGILAAADKDLKDAEAVVADLTGRLQAVSTNLVIPTLTATTTTTTTPSDNVPPVADEAPPAV